MIPSNACQGCHLGCVGGDDPEPLYGVRDVLDLLEDAVGVEVAVCAPDGAVGVAHLLLGGEAVLVPVVVAVSLVLWKLRHF